MALRRAITSGNWSNSTIWEGGIIPTVGDIVASNTYTVTIDQDIDVEQLTNAATNPVSVVPIMTSNTTPSGVVDASINLDPLGSFAAYKVFDNNSSTEWTGPNGSWVSYEFSSPKAINQYRFISYASKYTWSFQAWDGSSWLTLHSVTAVNFADYTSPLIGNSILYSKYRIVFVTGVGDGAARVHTIQFFEFGATTPALAGGGFILNDGVTVTCTDATSGIRPGTITCLTYSGTTSATINANVIGSGAISINKTGNGTLNVIGTLNSSTQIALNLSNNTGTTNIIGNVVKTFGNPSVPTLQSGTGNTINITGNLSMTLAGGANGKFLFISNGLNNINITGNIDGTNISAAVDRVISITTNDIVNITGNVLGVNTSVLSSATIFANGNAYLKIIGSISAGLNGPAIVNTFAGAINIFTGPFISSPIGIQPFSVARMHYQRTMGSYYEFRDNSTLGALPPSPPAPATRLVSPDTVVDAPIPANVRQGVVYASGSQTGTMIVPSPSNVSNNIPVDNTIGTAILNATNLWAINTSTMNTPNSIGERLKNAATVQSVGDQLASSL